MGIDLCILASGSSGNCSVVRTPGGVMLIDCGIGPRATTKRLAGTGVEVSDIRAICLTHLDRDHFNPNWLGTLLNHDIRIHCHRSRAEDVRAMLDHPSAERLIVPFDRTFEPIDGLSVRAIGLKHDRTGSHAFRLDGFGCRIGYATDLGRVPGELIAHFDEVDLLALESNYDPDMQLQSDRPKFLKQRIMSGAGHLSNQQAMHAIAQVLDRAERAGRSLPRHIVLLHRSRQCNCPKLMRELFDADPRIASRLTLADQYERTEWLRLRADEKQPSTKREDQPEPGEQFTMSFE